MASHDLDTPASEAAAELDRLTGLFNSAETDLSDARKALQEGIVRHLMARSAPPGVLSDHTPYDRNHVGRLGRDAGVPPLRGPNAAPPPVYEDAKRAAALAELDELTAAYTGAETAVEQARTELHKAIVRHYSARTLGWGALSEHTPYDRVHVGRVVKAAGAPPIRG
jgi:hypothetical protein